MVIERAKIALQIAERNSRLLSIGLDNLSLGLGWLQEATKEGNLDSKSTVGCEGNESNWLRILPRMNLEKTPVTEASKHLQRAIDGLRKSGSLDHIPCGLLGRSEFSRSIGDFAAAKSDLDETYELAIRCCMKLFEVDCHLAYARLEFTARRAASASGHSTPVRICPLSVREHYERARNLVAETGYHRRGPEVAALAKLLQSE